MLTEYQKAQNKAYDEVIRKVQGRVNNLKTDLERSNLHGHLLSSKKGKYFALLGIVKMVKDMKVKDDDTKR